MKKIPTLLRRDPDDLSRVLDDQTTGKRTGWVPILDEDKWHREAIARHEIEPPADGTYELVGPKVQGNPDGFDEHRLLEHAALERYPDAPTDRAGLTEWLTDHAIEGLVWHHPDGRMAKIKRRDVGLAWPA